MSDFSNPIFHDEYAARQWLEARLWPDGPICPHCGTVGEATLMKGKTTRPGLYQCNACRKPFTVTVGTLYERSKIPLHKWLAATHLMMASKKGMSALQVGRLLGVSKKTAWFLCHRIRASLDEIKPAGLGGEGKVIEADETYIGGREKNKHRSRRHSGVGGVGKQSVFALVERGGSVKSRHIPKISGATITPIMRTLASRQSSLMTDEGGQYRNVGKEYASHGTVNHSVEEYVRGDIHINTAENFFSILKRGIVGVYHHVSPQHLHLYLAEYDYRYSNREKLGYDDATRMAKSVKGIVGKRLTYRRADAAQDD